MIQLAKGLATKESICKDPYLPVVELPTTVIPQPSIVEFTGSQSLGKFVADNEWCMSTSSAIQSIHKKGMVGELVLDLVGLNSRATILSRKVLLRLSSFVIPRVPQDRTDLHPGRHWHWNSLTKKLKRISILCALSDHIPRNLELRGAHESYLDAADSFLVVEEEPSKLDGSYIVEDSSRGIILRAGATEQGFEVRWKEHQKASLLRASVGKQRRFHYYIQIMRRPGIGSS